MCLLTPKQVVGEQSAYGYFTNAKKQRLSKHHSNIVKFPNAKDVNLQIALKLIRKEMFSSTPTSTSVQGLGQRRQIQKIDSKNVRRQSTDPALGHVPSRTTPASATEPQQVWHDQLDVFMHENEIPDPLPGTCDWVMKKKYLEDWRKSPNDSMLIIHGKSGTGKSVLAKHIYHSLLEEEKADNTIVMAFFTDFRTSPRAPLLVLEHVLSQIHKRRGADHPELGREISDRKQWKVLWSTFERFLEKIDFKLFLIVDAIDETILENRMEGDQSAEHSIEEFLGKLCDRLSDSANLHSSDKLDLGNSAKSVQGRGKALFKSREGPELDVGSPAKAIKGRAKVLFTSREVAEIRRLGNLYPGILFELEDRDVEPGVQTMIDQQAGKFLGDKIMTQAERKELLGDIKDKAGPNFQWAKAAIQVLGMYQHRDNAFELCKARIARLETKLDDIYESTLKGIEDDPNTSDGHKSALVCAIQVLYFVESDLHYDQLDFLVAGVRARSQSNALSIHSHPRNSEPIAWEDLLGKCGQLVTFQTNSIELNNHYSVRQFLTGVHPKRWEHFGCPDLEKARANFTQVVLRFLVKIPKHLGVERNKLFQEHGTAIDGKTQRSLEELLSKYTPRYISLVKDLRLIWPDLTRLFTDQQAWLALLDAESVSARAGSTPPPVSMFLARCDLEAVIRKARIGPKTFTSRLKQVGVALVGGPRHAIYINPDDTDDYGGTILLEVVTQQNVELLEYLIDMGVRNVSPDDFGQTPFYTACRGPNEACALLLIKKGLATKEDLTGEWISPQSSLQLAASSGFDKVVEWMVKDERWDANEDTGNSSTALGLAITHQHKAVVDVLLKNGASASKGEGRDLPLMRAARFGDAEIVRLLFEADKNLEKTPTGEDDRTPLHYAASTGHFDVFNMLLKYGSESRADANGLYPIHEAAGRGNMSILRTLSSDDFRRRDNNGRTPLYWASYLGKKEAVEHCLERWSDDEIVNARCVDHDAEMYQSEDIRRSLTALASAVREGHNDIAHILLDHGASALAIMAKGNTCLHLAAFAKDDPNMIRGLLAKGGIMLSGNQRGELPIHIAAELGHINTFNFILEQGADIPDYLGFIDWGGRNVLHRAILAPTIDVLQRLEPYMKDYIYMTHGNLSPLGLASCTSCKDGEKVLDMVLKYDTDINRQNRFGETPLNLAVEHGTTEVTRKLMSLGADLNLANHGGETPIQKAIFLRKNDVAQELMKQGASLFERDATGKLAIEWVVEPSQLGIEQAQLDRLKALVKPLEGDIRELFIKSHVQRLLSLRQSLQETLKTDHDRTPGAKQVNFELLDVGVAILLRMLGKEHDEAVRTIHRNRMKKHPGNQVFAPCQLCRRHRRDREIHLCRSCYLMWFCGECYPNRSAHYAKTQCSSTHEFLVLTDDAWWDRPRNVVNDSGQSFEDWMIDFQKQYCGEPIPEPDLSEYAVDKARFGQVVKEILEENKKD